MNKQKLHKLTLEEIATLKQTLVKIEAFEWAAEIWGEVKDKMGIKDNYGPTLMVGGGIFANPEKVSGAFTGNLTDAELAVNKYMKRKDGDVG